MDQKNHGEILVSNRHRSQNWSKKCCGKKKIELNFLVQKKFGKKVREIKKKIWPKNLSGGKKLGREIFGPKNFVSKKFCLKIFNVKKF